MPQRTIRAVEIKIGDNLLEDDDGPLQGGEFVVHQIVKLNDGPEILIQFYGRAKGSTWNHYTNAESFLPDQKIVIEIERTKGE